jgi:hypothetical protein
MRCSFRSPRWHNSRKQRPIFGGHITWT